MSHIHMYMYVYVAGCICPTCYPWASVSFWFSWPRFGYKCALIAIPVAGRAEQSRVGRGRHLAQWVRFMGHNCTSASCGAWNLCHNTEDDRKEGKGDTLRLLLLCMPFVVRVAASLWVFASIIHAWHALPLYLYLSISLFSFLFHSARLFARLPAQEHPKAKFSLASAKSSELNVSIDSKRHCLNTHKHCATRFLLRWTKAKGEMGLRCEKYRNNTLNWVLQVLIGSISFKVFSKYSDHVDQFTFTALGLVFHLTFE